MTGSNVINKQQERTNKRGNLSEPTACAFWVLFGLGDAIRRVNRRDGSKALRSLVQQHEENKANNRNESTDGNVTADEAS